MNRCRRVEERHRARDPRPEHRRIGIAELEVVDVAAELPLQPAPLATTEEVRFLEAEEAAEAGPLPHRRTEVDVAGALLGDREGDVDVAVVERLDVGHRQRLFEEVQVGDVLVRADQPLAIEQLAREDDDRLADHPIVGDVVADDPDLVDVGRQPLVDADPEVEPGQRVARRRRASRFLGDHGGADVAVVGVAVLHLLAGRLPVAPLEDGADLLAGVDLRREREREARGDLLGGESRVAHDLDGADAILLSLVDRQLEDRLAGLRVGQQGVVGDLEVDEAPITVPRRQPGPDVLVDPVVVVLAVVEPEKSLRLRRNRARPRPGRSNGHCRRPAPGR